MRAAALFVQLTFFTVAEPRAPLQVAVRARTPRCRRSAKRRWRLRVVVVMVLGAILQFIKRVFHLIVGLLRLSYRKVCARSHPHCTEGGGRGLS